MEPRVQYAKTRDGVNIAFSTMGKGRAFIQMMIPVSNMAGHLRVREWNDWNEQIARRGMLVRYDCRGAGLSDRVVDDYSIDAWLMDIEAVVDRLNLDQFVLFSTGALAGPVSIAYAARWPERVSHLILWQAYTDTAHLAGQPGAQEVFDLLEKDWVTFTEIIAHSAEGWSEPETARSSAALIRENHSPEGLRSAFGAARGLDVAPLLQQVRSPTLVVHRRESRHDFAQSKKVASGIPDAKLVVVEGTAGSWALQKPEKLLEAIDDFLGDRAEPTAGSAPVSSGMTAILFADIADSTSLTERLGDAAFRAKARDLDAALRTVIREHGGTPIEGKLLGDGVLAVFTSARQAIAAALACARSGNDAGLPLHLGLHAGDVIREEGNVFGGAVNVAARVSGLAAPGEVLVSDVVRSLARTSAGVGFEDRGEREMKGVAEPVRVWAVRAEAE